ncbi:hypothetical protein [Acinetobacter bereziniae]|nr:hypothetical protein ACINWC743_2096 [Acinetobacter sp. WC-743]CEI53291.1 hypothetical protein [Acinetobacter bereziniae]
MGNQIVHLTKVKPIKVAKIYSVKFHHDILQNFKFNLF